MNIKDLENKAAADMARWYLADFISARSGLKISSVAKMLEILEQLKVSYLVFNQFWLADNLVELLDQALSVFDWRIA